MVTNDYEYMFSMTYDLSLWLKNHGIGGGKGGAMGHLTLRVHHSILFLS